MNPNDHRDHHGDTEENRRYDNRRHHVCRRHIICFRHLDTVKHRMIDHYRTNAHPTAYFRDFRIRQPLHTILPNRFCIARNFLQKKLRNWEYFIN